MTTREEQTSSESAVAAPSPIGPGVLWPDAIAALVVGLAALSALVATSKDFGMVWDEGHTIRRERTLAAWFQEVVAPTPPHTRSEYFSERMLAQYWPFSREEPDGHPPFYALLGLGGWAVTHQLLASLTAYRFGPMALCAITVGVVYFHMARRYGRVAAATASGSMLLMPRLFAHAHYAHYDMPMSCLWVLAQIAFVRCMHSARSIWLYGILLGLTASTKFTGWFAAGAALAWVGWFEGAWRIVAARVRRREGSSLEHWEIPGTKAVVYGLCVAAVVLVLLQPPWWFAPVRGVARFLESNLTRSETKPIPTLYLGEVYGFSLPWHNTLVITGVTVPVSVLVLGAVGICATIVRARSDRASVIWVFSWLVLMVVRALPTAPGHDMERQFLPSFLSLSILAGIGAGWVADSVTSRRVRWLASFISIAVLVECAAGLAAVYPYTLSYYNWAVGGLRGADRMGLERTYYWDTIGTEFFDWVRRESGTQRVELRFPSELINVQFLREWGDLPRDVPIVGLESTREPYYVLQRREGLYYPYDWWLDREGTPCFSITRQGVDLLRVYPYSESLRAFEATKNIPIPEYLKY